MPRLASARVKQRHLGRSGLVVSRLALGTMTWGRDTDEDDAAAQLDRLPRGRRDAGRHRRRLRRRRERAGARAAAGRRRPPRRGRRRDQGVRRRPARARWGAARAAGTCCPRWTPRCAGCGIDHVDLWQLHAWDPVTPWEEALAAVDTAVPSGRVRYAGVSQLLAAGSSPRPPPGSAALPAARRWCRTRWSTRCSQRGVEREVVPAALELGVGLLPWSPLGRGVLTGKYRNGAPADSRGAGSTFAGFVEPYLAEGARHVVDAVLTAADGLGVSPVAVALAWVRDRPGVVAPVVGARTAAQLQASLAAEAVELPAEIRAARWTTSPPRPSATPSAPPAGRPRTSRTRPGSDGVRVPRAAGRARHAPATRSARCSRCTPSSAAGSWPATASTPAATRSVTVRREARARPGARRRSPHLRARTARTELIRLSARPTPAPGRHVGSGQAAGAGRAR